jgi:uncharacterized protein YecT (DUF1311 family)
LLKGEANMVAALRKSQRSWLEYQKHNCKLAELVGAREGQVFGYTSSAHCLLLTTLERLDELRGYLESPYWETR